jgi:hypothetical protein
MRKSIIDPATTHPEQRSEQEWLDLEQVAKVEVTSEDANFPIESALASAKGPGWRATGKGKQIIRIIFDKPRPLRRIRLEFAEPEIERTQEFTLRWSASQADHLERLFASNGASVRMARRARSKIIRSSWITSAVYSWSLSLTLHLAKQ